MEIGRSTLGSVRRRSTQFRYLVLLETKAAFKFVGPKEIAVAPAWPACHLRANVSLSFPVPSQYNTSCNVSQAVYLPYLSNKNGC
jgi:hypothetical protein